MSSRRPSACRNDWQLQGSWVISKITGNYNNTSSFGNSTEDDDPNTDPIPAVPRRTADRTTTRTSRSCSGLYRAPWDIAGVGRVHYTSGNTFTRTVRVALPQGRPDLFIEPRGSQRLRRPATPRHASREAAPLRRQQARRSFARGLQPVQQRGGHRHHHPLGRAPTGGRTTWSVRARSASARLTRS